MCFRKKDEIAVCFSQHYKKMYEITKSEAWLKNVKFELLPAMYIICDIAAGFCDVDRVAVSNTIQKEIRRLYPRANTNIFNSRLDLYGEIIRGEKSLRCEFAFGDNEVWSETELSKIEALWCDLVFNPDCAENYDSAPYVIRDFFAVMRFNTTVLPKIIKEISMLYGDMVVMLTNKKVFERINL